jgi:hypothetical protein
MFVKKALSLVVGAICLQASMASFAADNAPSIEELWDIVQRQQTELEALKAKLEATRSQTRSVQVQSLENSQHLEVVAEAMEQPGAIGGSNWTDRTTIGGYGEMLYNDETSSASSKELDVQRFVLFASHEFNANLRFFSELEIEHSLIEDGAPGAVELEQAYIEWDYARNHSVLAGMHLVPMGILNETHEPNTFYGVERNRIESRIIPST